MLSFLFLFPDSNRLHYGQHTSFTLFFFYIFAVVWHTALKKLLGTASDTIMGLSIATYRFE